jgi:putative DNA primase/helicase
MSFLDFARANGLIVEDISPSDKIQRCPTERNPRKRNGSYMWDGQRGFVRAWDGAAQTQWYHDQNATAWTAEQQAKIRADQRQAEVAQLKSYEDAARRASVLMASATTDRHNYLEFKGFPDAKGLVLEDGELLIPMRNVLTNAVQGAQIIRWIEAERKYEKKMLKGMRAKAAVFRMGSRSQETVLVEGYATGLSVHRALRSMGVNSTVLITFSAQNLVSVAPMVKGRTMVFADNDKSHTGEQAALQTGLPYCMSSVVGEDANDLHARAGVMAVTQLLMEVRRRALDLSG